MTVPKFAGISHISFSARDAEACATWWHDVMGFEEYARVSGEDWFGIVLYVKYQPTSYSFVVGRAGLEPATYGFAICVSQEVR
jgi:catechol 2,3-dioxygenase-like lactoylglutathione lyase family enzyme